MTLFDQLYYALIEARDVSRATVLLAGRREALSEDRCGAALLECAVVTNNRDAIEFLVQHGVSINESNSLALFHVPLANVAMNGDVELLRWMIELGASVNVTQNGHCYSSALSAACIWGHLDCVIALVEAGAVVNAAWSGKNALSLATEMGHEHVAKYLRSVGAKLPSAK